jgi:hypothetical protein
MSRQSAGIPLNINGTLVTASGAELNKLDGVTATTAEIEKLATMTASAAELNKLDDSLITLTTVDDTALFTVGQIHTNLIGASFVYLEGVASVILGDVVSYIVTTTGAATTVRIVGNGVGAVGVAMAAVVGSKFGWFQIAGLNLVTGCDGSAAVGQAMIGGTAGLIDHTAAAGDLIHGMQIVVAEASNLCGTWLTFPSVTDKSGL